VCFSFHNFDFAPGKNFVQKKSRRLRLREAVQQFTLQPQIFNRISTQRRKDATKPQSKFFGLRWQSAAATPLFDCGQSFQSGVALRFPPQSKILAVCDDSDK